MTVAASPKPYLLPSLFSYFFAYMNTSGGYRAGCFGWETKDRRQQQKKKEHGRSHSDRKSHVMLLSTWLL
jgi:hypothetical protein